MKLNANDYKFFFMFLGLFCLSNYLYGKVNPSTSSTVKITLELISGSSSIFQEIEKNIFEATVVNNHSIPVTFFSQSDIRSFPKKIILQPKETQKFKFIATDINKANLFSIANNNLIQLKTYNDLNLEK